jgi:mycothiol synthase
MTFHFNAYSDTDRAELLSLWNRALPFDAITEDTFETRVLLDENFDPATFLVARDNKGVAGAVLGIHPRRIPLGDADPQGTRCWITALAVRPDLTTETTGKALLDEVEQRFRALGKKECRVSDYPPGYFTPGVDGKAYPALLNLFRTQGYAPFHEALSMDASIVLFQVPDATLAVEQRLAQEEIRIRHYRRTDLVEFLAFVEATMPTDWVRVERRNLRKIADGGFKERQVTIVTHKGAIIGYCQYEGSHFGPFGVSDAFQGRGIGTVLLARTIERMNQDGHHDAWIMWTDDRAAKVYGKFGFHETRRFVLMKKEL